MKIEVKKYSSKEGSALLWIVKFKITHLEDEEILKISQVSSLMIDMNPKNCGITNFRYRPISLGSTMKWIFNFKSESDGLLNFGELEKIELFFDTKVNAETYEKYILDQFNSEIKRISTLNLFSGNEIIYEIDAKEGIRKIYEGAEKVLNKNSIEYKEIVDRNREAWKKLADL
jgi:hypothetical protein